MPGVKVGLELGFEPRTLLQRLARRNTKLNHEEANCGKNSFVLNDVTERGSIFLFFFDCRKNSFMVATKPASFASSLLLPILGESKKCFWGQLERNSNLSVDLSKSDIVDSCIRSTDAVKQK